MPVALHGWLGNHRTLIAGFRPTRNPDRSHRRPSVANYCVSESNGSLFELYGEFDGTGLPETPGGISAGPSSLPSGAPRGVSVDGVELCEIPGGVSAAVGCRSTPLRVRRHLFIQFAGWMRPPGTPGCWLSGPGPEPGPSWSWNWLDSREHLAPGPAGGTAHSGVRPSAGP